MDKYLNLYREMISLRGLTDHTLKSYKTYISAYLDFVFDLLKKDPSDVTWDEMRLFIKHLQKTLPHLLLETKKQKLQFKLLKKNLKQNLTTVKFGLLNLKKT